MQKLTCQMASCPRQCSAFGRFLRARVISSPIRDRYCLINRNKILHRKYCSQTGLPTKAAATPPLSETPEQGKEVVLSVDVEALRSQGKLRLDAYLCTQLQEASRAKIQSSIKDGRVTINGRPQLKASHAVKAGDIITCSLPPPRRLEAEPEALPLDVVHEDRHLMVLNKAAGMVVHPSPGHYTGTLVNALLHWCELPAMQLAVGSPAPSPSLIGSSEQSKGEAQEEEEEEEESMDDEESSLIFAPLQGQPLPVIRPGIVHRLDKGTSGLLVVAKDDFTHAKLCEQFKKHSVERAYYAITIGVPKEESGVVETNIGRATNDRKRMAAFGFHSSRGRHATSRYEVLEALAGGRAALVQWRLETGRTHQIRVHAKHIGYPILADDTYGGGASTALNFIAGKNTSRQHAVRAILKGITRPALHAKTLGFQHPRTQEQLSFASELPADFTATLEKLRDLA